MAPFGVLPMVQLVILPMEPLVANGNWLTNGTIGLLLAPIVPLGRPMVPLVLPNGITNGITIGAIGKILNDIGIPLVPLGNPEHTQSKCVYKLHDVYNCKMCRAVVLPDPLHIMLRGE